MDGMLLGHFTIVEKVGEGGMGVVYKARDTRLGRMVAIKALPDSKTADADRTRRFAQEAKAVSALNHPNIITIYDIAEYQEHNYIVMEFVDGKPLGELIPKRGMKLTEALRLAVQIADGIAAAHAAGIVHRDLKPGNIMVDAQGRVKVLDFGLAKLMASSGVALSDDSSTAVMSAPITEQNTILGTVAYMSPEQAEGMTVDTRSDIFSFGAMLYEMIAGQKAFVGESWASTLSAVVERDPKPLSEITPTAPPELERLIGRCLRKDVSKRSQHMLDVKLALEELRDESESGKLMRPVSTTSPLHSASRWRLWAAILASLILAAGLVWIYRNYTAAARFQAPELTRLSPDDGYSYSAPAISPDAKLVAYVSDRSGKPELWLQQVGGSVPIQVTHSQNQVAKAAFFPDGTRILYLAASPTADRKDTIEIVSSLGGEPQVLVAGSFPYTANFPNFAISPDGRQLAYVEVDPSRRRLVIMPTDGGQSRSLQAWDDIQLKSVFFPQIQWTPDGRFLLCFGSTRAGAGNFDEWDWFLIPVDGGKPVAIGAGERLRASGFNLAFPNAILGSRAFITGPILMRGHAWQVKLLPGAWRLDDKPQQLSFGTEDEVPFSVTTGVVALQSGKQTSDLYLVPFDRTTGNASGITRRLTQDSREKDPALAGGGGDPRLAYFAVPLETRSGFVIEGYSLDLESGRQSRLTTLPSLGDRWTVSRDGRQIAYSVPDGDRFSIRIGEGGSSVDSARNLCRGCGLVRAFSPDGRSLLYDAGRPVRPDPHRRASIHLLDVTSGRDKVWLEDATASVELRGFIGQRSELAMVSAREPTAPAASARTFLVPWREEPVPRPEWIEVPVRDPQFSATRDLVYFFKDAQLQAARFDPKMKRFGAPYEVRLIPGSQPVPKPDDSWTIRGSGLVFARRETRTSVWLLKLSD